METARRAALPLLGGAIRRTVRTRSGQLATCVALVVSGVLTPIVFRDKVAWLLPVTYVFPAAFYLLWLIAAQYVDSLFIVRPRTRGPKPDFLPIVRRGQATAGIAAMVLLLSAIVTLVGAFTSNVSVAVAGAEVLMVTIVALLASLRVGVRYRAVG
jgi:hypothetical protein